MTAYLVRLGPITRPGFPWGFARVCESGTCVRHRPKPQGDGERAILSGFRSFSLSFPIPVPAWRRTYALNVLILSLTAYRSLIPAAWQDMAQESYCRRGLDDGNESWPRQHAAGLQMRRGFQPTVNPDQRRQPRQHLTLPHPGTPPVLRVAASKLGGGTRPIVLNGINGIIGGGVWHAACPFESLRGAYWLVGLPLRVLPL
ncbi:hypothetical protein B0J13DRAFT_537357 [Dactylonectria estremocensis]|uniref:Uncharacterized protein n=1 Tax=Dactylonectria estremocensis TaxID=1079267 RepID=A0A9P9FHR9_9HYPO|nr:hypothetical protein B0J13DRAFT_537357 [Dactylonectria estremocensis]